MKQSKQNRCKHYSGIVNDTCKKGVNYRQLVGGPDFGWATRLPCNPGILGPNGPVVSCDKYEKLTNEEIAAEDAAIDALIARHDKAAPVVDEFRKRNKGKSVKEVVVCPVCNGKLHLSIAACNGHVWGACETKDCLAWME